MKTITKTEWKRMRDNTTVGIALMVYVFYSLIRDAFTGDFYFIYPLLVVFFLVYIFKYPVKTTYEVKRIKKKRRKTK